MNKFIAAVLTLLFGLSLPAIADPSSDWLRTVIQTTQALARHPDLKKAATTYDQRLTVRFEIDRNGKVGRLTAQRDKATREAAQIVRQLTSNGTTSHRASRCRMVSWKALTAASATSA